MGQFQLNPNRPKNIIEDMISAITKGTPVAVDGIEGCKSVEIFCAIYESANKGMPVELSQQ